MTSGDALDISRLATAAGVPVRTVRFYVSSRLLPGPGGRGRAATYTEEHLERLRLIRALAEQRVPLEQIRNAVAPLDRHEVRELLERERRRSAGELEARTTSPRDHASALLDRADRAPGAHSAAGAAEAWRRIGLAPGMELHVRTDGTRRYRALVERIVKAARAGTGKADGQDT